MKNIPIIDFIFIIISTIILVLINEFGYSELLSKYPLILVLIAFYMGKYFGRLELRKKANS